MHLPIPIPLLVLTGLMKAALRKWLLQALNGKTLSERSEFGLP
jgi:hypothetical protein